MKLSIIIVNYNVRYFLEQCLYSVQRAAAGIDMEVIVIDNQSTDDSINYLKPKFPGVRFFANDVNMGFAKACNYGFSLATGEFILFLNPDTLVAEDTFSVCLSFMQDHQDAGALGVKMIDGSGSFLKESKRSFPSPVTSSFKLFGLSRLFPRSGVFSRYHLGHLDRDRNHEVDVLAGAFMMVRRHVLDKVGLFDETFFMYGEDIDLSYRIQKAGYKNYYLADTTIIHFKGESTRMGSLNYVLLFYNAMRLFVRKHYGGARATIFGFFIQLAIGIRALMAAVARFVRKIGLFFIDALMIFCSFWLVKEIWVHWVKPEIVYKNQLFLFSLPAFTVLYLLVAYYAGLYDRYYRRSGLLGAPLVATTALLAIYSLLPEQLRFSRGIVVFGALSALVLIALVRWMLVRTEVLDEPEQAVDRPYILVAGSLKEYQEVEAFLTRKLMGEKIIGRIAVEDHTAEALGYLDAVEKTASALNAQDLIICMGTLSLRTIIQRIQEIRGVKLRFHFQGSNSIVGSDVATAAGAVLSAEPDYTLDHPGNRRFKRLIDVCFSLASVITFPVHLFLVKHPGRFLQNCLSVLTGKKTWVGYYGYVPKLPNLRKGILWPGGFKSKTLSEEQLQRMDYWYARNYDPATDIRIILGNYKYLGSDR